VGKLKDLRALERRKEHFAINKRTKEFKQSPMIKYIINYVSINFLNDNKFIKI